MYFLFFLITSLKYLIAYATKLSKTLHKIKKSIRLNGWFYSWFLHDSNGINDQSFSLSNLKRGILKEIFAEGFELSFDNYKYTENKNRDFIEFQIFAAQRTN